jgi:hypothetical protein
MMHTVDYSDSTSAAQTDSDIPLSTDPSVTILNGHPIFPVPIWVVWAYALGLTVTRVRISTPRVKPITRPLVRPVESAAAPSSRPQLSENWRRPIKLNPVEEIQMLRTNTTAVAERDHVVLTVGDLNFNVPQGDCYTARFTQTLTTTANTWSSAAISFDDTLMTGRYSVVGLDVQLAAEIAARLIFPGAPIAGSPPQIRPGVLGEPVGGEGTRWFRWGFMGEFGQFESFAAPAVEHMNTAATAVVDGFADLVLVRPGALGLSM